VRRKEEEEEETKKRRRKSDSNRSPFQEALKITPSTPHRLLVQAGRELFLGLPERETYWNRFSVSFSSFLLLLLLFFSRRSKM
jgi:hypothetical protein